MRQDAHNRLQPLVPDRVLMDMRVSGMTPLAAWMRHRQMHAFDLATKVLGEDALAGSRDALAMRIQALMDEPVLPAGMTSRLARGLDIPDLFLMPSFYEESWGIVW